MIFKPEINSKNRAIFIVSSKKKKFSFNTYKIIGYIAKYSIS